MSFSINKKLIFIDSFQYLSSSLDSSVKNLAKDDFKYLTQELDNNVLDLVKQERFYPYEYVSNFDRFKEQLPRKKKIYIFLTSKNLVIKNMNMFSKFRANLK